MSAAPQPGIPGWTTMWAPEQGAEITAAVLAQIHDGMTNGATLFSSQYAFTDVGISGVMGAFGRQNRANRYVFDRSQFFGARERALVEGLIAGLLPDQWAIGTSPVGDEILHSKILALLYPDGRGWTFSGSFNLSASAEKEFNVADLIWSRSRAEAFAAQIQARLTWCRTNQPQPPAPKGNCYLCGAPVDAPGREETPT